jgi:hypothetical protein
MKTIDDVLDRVTEDIGAMIPRPASKKDLRLCQKDMTELKFPPIPQGYADFLSKLNGFAWNGIEFFSTDQILDNATNYMLNDIVSANEDFALQNEDFLNVSDYVCLGRADEDLFVYNTKNAKYEVLDSIGRDVMEEYGSFDELFIGVVAPRI